MLTDRWEWAASLVESGGCITQLCPQYPARWLGTRRASAGSGPGGVFGELGGFGTSGVVSACRGLGSAAPPVMYARGDLTSLGGGVSEAERWSGIAIVGSRELSAAEIAFARAAGAAAAGLGAVVISGGAAGADREAVLGALCAGDHDTSAGLGACESGREGLSAGVRAGGRAGARKSLSRCHAVEILPCGFDHATLREGVVQVTLWPASTAFSTAGAMERNVLVYAASEAAILVAVRHGAGGTWHGAREALRRRLCPLLVHSPPTAQPGSGTAAFLAMGAVELPTSLEVESLRAGVLESLRRSHCPDGSLAEFFGEEDVPQRVPVGPGLSPQSA